ncbi:transposable element Tc1 transposase [Trichonephila clavipes]|nr:transposable element Tc1 transposase [Trichonephila clavipes]
MPRNLELSDFEKDIVVGYHGKGQFLIASELDISKSSVAYTIKVWKVNDACQNVRPAIIRDRERRVLSKEIRKTRTKLMIHILQEFQEASGTVVSIYTICKTTLVLVFHFPAATHKPLITKSKHAVCLRWCKTRRN